MAKATSPESFMLIGEKVKPITPPSGIVSPACAIVINSPSRHRPHG
jgi:hypothetical protein